MTALTSGHHQTLVSAVEYEAFSYLMIIRLLVLLDVIHIILDLQQASVVGQVTHKTLTAGDSSREKDLMLSVQQLLDKYESGWQPVVVHHGGGGRQSLIHCTIVWLIKNWTVCVFVLFKHLELPGFW